MRGGSSSSVKVYYPRLSRDEAIRIIRKRLQTLSEKMPLCSAILFGSYAKGRYTASSDIDLLVVYDDPKRDDAYSLAWDEIGIPQLQLHIYTVSEYEALRRSGSSLPKEALKGIVVWSGDH